MINNIINTLAFGVIFITGYIVGLKIGFLMIGILEKLKNRIYLYSHNIK